ncbi:uncharacterized protein FOMMEDRAFT_162542 [Fomitiporia mediterranea MF3/22]|uniref:Uncharacterized protein n=1 Tax=Fomitiporia mediterranea (strain MF3/22) TaxID=694068 RepID=R7SJI9_FOMME|nr:uncharacterized protein FOMMEDRAFT_162542 [Fomitiporia mediterranea MF3/22]EJC97734.1 hypothetical protein FOMMEDRAFT_162542 [Fomitiporia mediterranea MF3/22]
MQLTSFSAISLGWSIVPHSPYTRASFHFRRSRGLPTDDDDLHAKIPKVWMSLPVGPMSRAIRRRRFPNHWRRQTMSISFEIPDKKNLKVWREGPASTTRPLLLLADWIFKIFIITYACFLWGLRGENGFSWMSWAARFPFVASDQPRRHEWSISG